MSEIYNGAKRCTKCGLVKPLSEYYCHTLRGKYVPHSECKSRTVIMVKKYREAHPEFKEVAKKRYAIYYAKNRDKILARDKSNYSKKKEVMSTSNRKYYEGHHSEILERRKQYRKDNRDKINARNREDYNNNPDKNKARYIRNKEQKVKTDRDRRIRIKTEVVTYYGDGKCQCVRCGFNDVRALSIDHVNGDGAEHRKKEDVRGDHLYLWLRKNGFPKGYQTLCMNCQYIKRSENREFYNSRNRNNGTAGDLN